MTVPGLLLPLADHGSLQQSLIFLGPVVVLLFVLLAWTLIDRRRRSR